MTNKKYVMIPLDQLNDYKRSRKEVLGEVLEMLYRDRDIDNLEVELERMVKRVSVR